MTTELALLIALFFLSFIFILMDLIILQKWALKKEHHLQGVIRDMVFSTYMDGEEPQIKVKHRFFFDVFIDIETQVTLDPDVRKKIISDLLKMPFTHKQFRRLHSLSSVKRRKAIFYLSHLRTKEAVDALKNRFKKEKNEAVRFYLAYHLMSYLDQPLVDQIILSLEGSSEHYQRWMRNLISNHYTLVKPYLKDIYTNHSNEVAYLLLEIADHHLEEPLKNYTLRIFNEALLNESLQKKALSVLSHQYPDLLHSPAFLQHEKLWVRQTSIKACGQTHNEAMILKLLGLLSDEKHEEDVTQAISKIVFEKKNLLLFIIEQYAKEKKMIAKRVIARVLSQDIDYLTLKLKGGGYDYILSILEMIFELHVIEDFIDFMNHNKDLSLEQKYLPLIKKYAAKDDYIREQLQIYATRQLLNKLGLMKKSQPVIPREKSPLEKDKIIWISVWVTIGFVLLPLIAFFSNLRLIFSGDINVFELMVISVNRYLVFYFLSVNTLYLGLLFLSVKGAKDRLSLWDMKKDTLLFERGLLPSISIIAPAYNEEKSIIESITSLLNLKYPIYEVIVVNDGSKDKTIDVLVEHFKLERKHPFFKEKIKTKGLRGVYVNRQIPNLVVIDKQNGGKADALNMGINVAKYDYVCGIDADSLLEENALLKLMSVTLDDHHDFIALGGNIIPVNGCEVDQGKIEKQGLGKKHLVRFQTIEYLRAFTTGRIGWSSINSLLIISGAFGLFKRQSLIDTGGYLTISGELKKDTVGEDMELVVRLTHRALKEKKKYKVSYVHLANCYTELPSDAKSLFKQRNRWQRGLLDILSYHRRMLFNPKYKQPGMIGFPYFFIFEMVGPFIEFLGYIALIAGLALGILNTSLVIMLFVVTIGYGIVLSLFSLLVAERRQTFYSMKETIILVLYAIIENFGFRQVTSLHRVISTFSALREKGSWGSQQRQGFKKV
jgi:cellulose synthase/poly-beta-1,6-N-acetylglucosamine synthase-like glycosyltransferase